MIFVDNYTNVTTVQTLYFLGESTLTLLVLSIPVYFVETKHFFKFA